MYDTHTVINGNKYKAVLNRMDELNVGALNKRLPNYVWSLSKRQSLILLNSLIEGDGSRKDNHAKYCTSSSGLADDVSKLAFHSGLSGQVNRDKKKGDVYTATDGTGRTYSGTCNADSLFVSIITRSNEPTINKNDHRHQTDEKYVYYAGKVYCLEIPDTHQHVYYSRESNFSPPAWTGNSSRSGQKSTVGLAMRDSDMPSTIDGMKPSIIINPHGIPSRMTIGQLIESQVSTLCAAKSATMDATIFKKIDIESVATELEGLGLDRYGYRRMFNGITGEYIDCEIFIGPTYYQRLQKFTIDTIYSVSGGPSDAITYQPLDGKASGGGLRIGEMERDCLVSHGSARFMSEKYFAHSDGYTEYVCRCGKSAVVNIGKGIYQCKYCKANASIAALPTSWSSKLFIQELEMLGVGIKRMPEPFTYDISDAKICELIEDGRNGITNDS